jgi:hypothetical protein
MIVRDFVWPLVIVCREIQFDLVQAAVKVMVEVFSCVLWCWAK